MRKITGLLLMLVSGPIFAYDFSYGIVQVGYFSSETEVLGVTKEGDVISFFGSAELNENIYAGIGVETGFYDGNIDTTAVSVGLGAHKTINDKVDAVGECSFLNAEISQYSTTETDTGYSLSFGARYAALDNIELSGGVGIVNIFNESTNSFGVGARAYLEKQISAGVGYSFTSDTNSLGFSLRVAY